MADEYDHVNNDFNNADIELAGAGAEEAQKTDKTTEEGVDKPSKGGEGDDAAAKKADAAKPDGDQGKDGEEGKEDGDKQPSGDEEEAKRRPRYERRIDTLTARNKVLEERLGKLEKAGKGDDPEHRGEEDNAPSDAKPVITDFDSYEDFVEALVEYRTELKLKSRDETNQKQTAEDGFKSRLDEGKKAFADWDEVVTEDVTISGAMAQAIKEADNPAAVIHYLGSNPDEADAIVKLSLTRQIAEIGKIEAKVGGKVAAEGKPEEKSEKKTTSAPPAIKPPKGGDTKTEKSVEDMDPDEYIRYMNRKQGIGSVHAD